jgi:predicted outer membrane repeat protein
MNSSPVFIDCDIVDSSAFFGSGGAAYCDVNSSPLFTNCNFEDSFATGDGGGLYYNIESTSVLRQCTFTNNTADIGGGIYYNMGCVSDINDCTFTNNLAFGDGGAILYEPNNSTIMIADCNFTDNSATYGGALYFDPNCSGIISKTVLLSNAASEDGGAIYMADSNMAIMDCNNINYNTAARGGAFYCVDSPGTSIIDCAIKYNEATRVITYFEYYTPNPDANLPPITGGDPNDPNVIVIVRQDRSGAAQGGGIYSSAGPTLIENCELSYNLAGTSGGGIYFADGEFDVTKLHNCLVTNNSAGRDGAGISNNWRNDLAISNCTIAHNTLTNVISYGGGLSVSYESNTEVIDSIISGNLGTRGSQLAVTSDDPPKPLPSKVKVTHSDISLDIEQMVEGADRRLPESGRQYGIQHQLFRCHLSLALCQQQRQCDI